MLLNVIFSYNRAMQLDYLLQSILEKYKVEQYDVAIIYHTTGEHAKGYQLLIENFKDYPFIKFYERKEGFDFGIIPAINCRTHLRFFNDYHFKNKKRDNFKGLLENILTTTPHEFVMFNTDDGVFLEDFTLPYDLQNLIRYNPNVSYRTYVGDNIEGFPSYVKQWGDYYLWDYYYDEKITHWSYPFSVDGTVYNTKYLVKWLNKIAYHNPITLEEKAVKYFIRNKMFGIGLSPIKSLLIGTILNRVSVDSFNPALNINIDFLNQKYVDGYRLELLLTDNRTNVVNVPKKVTIFNNSVSEILYELDEQGESVQKQFGAEGAKTQME